MGEADQSRGLSRRTLLIGGGVGAGLVVAWALWPRGYTPNLRTGPGETLFNAFLKIGNDGRVVVAVPQTELGQGVWTSLPQALADELGADWRTIAVEAAPVSPLYANRLLAGEAADERWPGFLSGVGRWAEQEYATRGALMLTGGSTSIRAFEPAMREAGAAARALLMKAAGRRWNVEWEALDTALGFVINGADRLAFAELAEEAAKEEVPEYPPMRGGVDNRLAGQPLARLDAPAKIDGSAQFAGDIRLPDLVYASARSAPSGRGTLDRLDREAALRVPGVIGIYDAADWVAAVATTWWAANKGLEASRPAWRTPGGLADSAAIETALAAALDGDDAARLFTAGDPDAVLSGPGLFTARYSAAPAPTLAPETLTATARLGGDRLEIWAPTQAPGLARAAAARASGLGIGQVTIYPTLAGGGYGRKLEVRAIEQAAILAARTRRPVQLVWSRIEESVQDTFRAPAAAELAARLGEGGLILGWRARIAAPDTAARLAERLGGGAAAFSASVSAAAGALPPYAIPSAAVDLLPADVRLPVGAWRSGARGTTVFFAESFVDELSREAGVEPFSFRMQMLGDDPRLARCLATATAIGGWDGGPRGSALGLAAHSAYGSRIALLVEAEIGEDRRPRALRAVAAVDCGRIVNPDLVRQQIEGGIVYGLAAAAGLPIRFEGGRPSHRGLRDAGFPPLAFSPEITVELLDSDEDPGGVTELSVPVAAPALANAVFALTGERLRSLPLSLAAR